MKVQPHSSNLQLTHKANRSWIGDGGQGIGKEKPFSQCHQHISSSSILEALSSWVAEDQMPAVVKESSLGTGGLFETDYWIWTLLSPLDCNKGVWQPFVAASGWNMSYAITIWLQQQSQQGFVAANVSTWRCTPSNCWLLIQTFGWLVSTHNQESNMLQRAMAASSKS